MNLIPLDDVIIPESRHRRHFDDEKLEELADSIAEVGLIHLPVLRRENGRMVLVSGERRMRAIRKLYEEDRVFLYGTEAIPHDCLPYADFAELDPLVAEEIELMENTVRADLSWQERAVATARLHKLRVAQNPDQSYSDTAQELFDGIREEPAKHGSEVKTRVIIAENITNPRVAAAKNEREALKAIYRDLEHDMMRELTARVLDAPETQHVVECKDALEALRALPPGLFDIVLTDPPYGIDVHKSPAISENRPHEYDDSWNTVQELLLRSAEELTRVTKDKAHLYLFCDIQYFHLIARMYTELGWYVWTRPIIWVKNVGLNQYATHGPQRLYETILYAIKGSKPVTAVYGDVVSFPIEQNKVHAAQKPVDLYVNLLRRSATPGDYVLDPFCGSGTILEAAHRTRCTAYAYDNDPTSVAYAKERLMRVVSEVTKG